jgi:hypothetical protein
VVRRCISRPCTYCTCTRPRPKCLRTCICLWGSSHSQNKKYTGPPRCHRLKCSPWHPLQFEPLKAPPVELEKPGPWRGSGICRLCDQDSGPASATSFAASALCSCDPPPPPPPQQQHKHTPEMHVGPLWGAAARKHALSHPLRSGRCGRLPARSGANAHINRLQVLLHAMPGSNEREDLVQAGHLANLALGSWIGDYEPSEKHKEELAAFVVVTRQPTSNLTASQAGRSPGHPAIFVLLPPRLSSSSPMRNRRQQCRRRCPLLRRRAGSLSSLG